MRQGASKEVGGGGKNIIAIQQQKNLDKHFTNLEEEIN